MYIYSPPPSKKKKDLVGKTQAVLFRRRGRALGPLRDKVLGGGCHALRGGGGGFKAGDCGAGGV